MQKQILPNLMYMKLIPLYQIIIVYKQKPISLLERALFCPWYTFSEGITSFSHVLKTTTTRSQNTLYYWKINLRSPKTLLHRGTLYCICSMLHMALACFCFIEDVMVANKQITSAVLLLTTKKLSHVHVNFCLHYNPHFL